MPHLSAVRNLPRTSTLTYKAKPGSSRKPWTKIWQTMAKMLQQKREDRHFLAIHTQAYTLWHKIITYEKLFWNNYFRKKLRISRVIPWKYLSFLDISRAQKPSEITKNNSQGIIFVIISCQRVIYVFLLKKSRWAIPNPCFRASGLIPDPLFGLIPSPRHFRSTRVVLGSVTVWGWNGSISSGFGSDSSLCGKGLLLFQYSFRRKGRFRFRFPKNSSGGSGFWFRFGSWATLLFGNKGFRRKCVTRKVGILYFHLVSAAEKRGLWEGVVQEPLRRALFCVFLCSEVIFSCKSHRNFFQTLPLQCRHFLENPLAKKPPNAAADCKPYPKVNSGSTSKMGAQGGWIPGPCFLGFFFWGGGGSVGCFSIGDAPEQFKSRYV